MAIARAGAGAEIMTKVGAENKQFRLRNTERNIHNFQKVLKKCLESGLTFMARSGSGIN